MKLEAYLNVVKKFIKDEVSKANAMGLVVGLSGGVDSAVMALLIKAVFPKNHLCLIMPCDSNRLDKKLALELAEKHDLNYRIIDLTSTYNQLKAAFLPHCSIDETLAKLVLGNIKARLRMTTLYAIAQANNYLVSGTDNADEWYTGYFTKYGDGGVDLLPLIRLLKQDILAAAKILGVIPEIINRPATAGLWSGQTDESELGFSYQELDNYLLNNCAVLKPEVIAKIKYYHQKSAHKRELIPVAPKWNRK